MPLPVNLPEERLQPERQASTVFALDGTPIGQFKGAETQVEVSAENIPDTIRRAVIAAEDHRFFSHQGVDYKAVLRAVQENRKAGKVVQGASTITQQLIRNLYTGSERTFARKAKEALLAIQAERVYSKEEILARYLNTVYLGESTFGVEAASQSYFRKPAKDITLSEAALLAGVIPAPSVYSPRANPELAEQRRILTLDLLAQYRMATPEELATARAERPVIHPPPKVETQYPLVHGLPARLPLEREGLYGATGLRRQPPHRDDVRPPPAGRRRAGGRSAQQAEGPRGRAGGRRTSDRLRPCGRRRARLEQVPGKPGAGAPRWRVRPAGRLVVQAVRAGGGIRAGHPPRQAVPRPLLRPAEGLRQAGLQLRPFGIRQRRAADGHAQVDQHGLRQADLRRRRHADR